MSELVYTAIGLGLAGIAFLGLYAANTERLWWAVIPGIASFTLLVALIVDVYVGTDPANDWTAALVIAAGAALTAVVLKRADARRVLAIVAVFALAIGVLMAPLDMLTQVMLVVAIALGVGTVTFGNRGHTTTLRPH